MLEGLACGLLSAESAELDAAYAETPEPEAAWRRALRGLLPRMFEVCPTEAREALRGQLQEEIRWARLRKERASLREAMRRQPDPVKEVIRRLGGPIREAMRARGDSPPLSLPGLMRDKIWRS
jgi:hypothetical protein